jgi:transcriptional regulator with XRE-family HTH domain
MGNIGRRIRFVRLEAGLNQSDFAKSLGLSQTFISSVETNVSRLTILHLATITNKYNVNLNWLITGEGEIFKGAAPQQADNAEDLPKENIKKWFDEFWNSATDDRRTWLKIEFARHFPEYAEWLKKKEAAEERRKPLSGDWKEE